MTQKVKRAIKKGLGFLLVITLLLCVPPIAQGVANVAGNAMDWTKDKTDSFKNLIVDTARGSLIFVAGAFVLFAASWFVAVPVIAGALVVASFGLLAWGVYNVLRPKGQKPDNVVLDSNDM